MTFVFATKNQVFWISPSKTQTSFQQNQTILNDFLRTCEYFNFRWTLRLSFSFVSNEDYTYPLPSATMLGIQINPVTVAKDPGVYIDCHLNFNERITKLPLTV